MKTIAGSDYSAMWHDFTCISAQCRLDRDGERLDIQAEDFFARVIQHEVDHLQGKVFLDRLPNLNTLTYLREYQKYWQSKD